MKNNLTNIEEWNIDATVGNGHKIKCDIKGKVNMKLQWEEKVKFNVFLYVLQANNKVMSILRIIYKGVKMGATNYNMNIKKNGVNINIDSRK